MVQFADPAEATAAFRVARVGHQRAGDPQAEGAGEGVGDSRVGGVGVGVGDVQRDVVLDQRVHDAALEGAGLDGGGAPQVEGVVGDDQVGAQLHRLVGDLLDGVHGEQDPGDLGVRVAADGSDGIPLLGPRGGPESVQRGDDFRETGHGPRLPSGATVPVRPALPVGPLPLRGGQTGRSPPAPAPPRPRHVPAEPQGPPRTARPARAPRPVPVPPRPSPGPREGSQVTEDLTAATPSHSRASRLGDRAAQPPRPPRTNRRTDTRMCEAVLVVLFDRKPGH